MMPYAFLSAEAVPAAAEGTDWAGLLLQYCIYAAIIVVGLVALWVIRHHNKLPSHPELKRRLEGLASEIETLIADCGKKSVGSYDFFKRISKLLYNTDRLVYFSTLLADKERDGDIGNISIALENARDTISPYKFRTKTQEEPNGLYEALEKVRSAAAIMDKIIRRDRALSEKEAKAK